MLTIFVNNLLAAGTGNFQLSHIGHAQYFESLGQMTMKIVFAGML